jgi:hypothetical protein
MLQSVTYSAATFTFHTADVSVLSYCTEKFFSPPVTPLPNAGLGVLIPEVLDHTHTHTHTGRMPLNE